MKTNWPTQITGRRQIGRVIKYLDYQRSITGNVSGDDYAGFHIDDVPGANDESSYHIAKSILRKLENEGYIKFTDTTSIMELKNFCVVEFLPKYKLVKFRYLFAVNLWELTNPFWLIWQFIQIVFSAISLLWKRSKILTIIINLMTGLLVYDWSLAWKNIKIVLNYLI
jgi:hypothetical protein